ncbi:uncharacterized protein LOC107366045 [Tetranychus urticae]|uniref:Uncharacterized protein n=1 Tax=Tetranychus urticae TaxID=32264 RepID=T1KQ05_TETUR|nr:uncharacterized protein LOC107366045 [Tetranychus urticae]
MDLEIESFDDFGLRSPVRSTSRNKKWFERTEALNLKDDDVSIRSKIWNFGLNLMKPSYIGEGRDYSSTIKNLINVGLLKSTRNEEKDTYSCTWQIYDKNGQTHTDKDLKDYIRTHYTRKVDIKKDLSVCTYRECDRSTCTYHDGKTPRTTNTVVGKISKLIATWYCVYCQEPLSYKAGVGDHGKACPYQVRAASEDPQKSDSRSNKNLRGAQINVEKITSPESFEEELNNFLEKIHYQMQASDCYSEEKGFDIFMEELKQNPSFEFIEVFKKFHYSPTKYRVNIEDDKFYQIIYVPKNIRYPDKAKSPRFQMVEISAEKVITIHRLDAIRDQAIGAAADDEKCHYDGCACGGKFENGDQERLIGHVFENNIVIVCVGCGLGLRNIKDYEEHLRPQCWLPRPSTGNEKNNS